MFAARFSPRTSVRAMNEDERKEGKKGCVWSVREPLEMRGGVHQQNYGSRQLEGLRLRMTTVAATAVVVVTAAAADADVVVVVVVACRRRCFSTGCVYAYTRTHTHTK